MTFRIWTTSAKAKSIGCTHRARLFGVIPGYYGMASGLWVPKSDVLLPVEWVFERMWWLILDICGDERDFSFQLRGRI